MVRYLIPFVFAAAPALAHGNHPPVASMLHGFVHLGTAMLTVAAVVTAMALVREFLASKRPVRILRRTTRHD